MEIKFLTDYPVLFLPKIKSLVISDLHIGIEHELFKSGIFIQPQAEKFRLLVEKLAELTKAKNLIILGDVKHEVPGISLREERQIPKFFEPLTKKSKIILAKGNHDTELKGLIPEEVKIYGSSGFKIKNYGFFHGHAWPNKLLMKCDYLFMGHIQPAIDFRDKFGYRFLQQVWLRGKLDPKKIREKYKIKKTGKLNIVIFPSFNKLSGSLSINKAVNEQLLGPLLTNKVLDLNNCKAYFLDGTYIGLVKQFREIL